MIKILSASYKEGQLNEARHYHDCHQIIFVLRGSVELCVNKAKQIVEAGNMMVFSRFENHSINILSVCFLGLASI